METKTLGTLALVSAPFLFLGLSYEKFMQISAVGDTRLGGAYSLIYMAGWMCSLVGLLRIEATGSNLFGRGIIWLNLFTLLLANIQNLAQLFLPWDLFAQVRLILDHFWPISHVLMLVIGIATLSAKKLMGWQRFTPLFIGLWLPIAFLTNLLPVNSEVSFYGMALYTAVAWSLLALTVRNYPINTKVIKPGMGDFQLT